MIHSNTVEIQKNPNEMLNWKKGVQKCKLIK
jgi:hypothetical protein